jgi:hypothetical protein
MPSNADERSLGDLFAELSRETGILIRKKWSLRPLKCPAS